MLAFLAALVSANARNVPPHATASTNMDSRSPTLAIVRYCEGCPTVLLINFLGFCRSCRVLAPGAQALRWAELSAALPRCLKHSCSEGQHLH